MFKKQKNDFLTKKDKSRKGNIDKHIKKLVNKINSMDNYYTTSSCSGRLILLAIPKSVRKNNIKWIFSSHNKVIYSEIKKVLPKIKKIKKDVWLRSDPAIMHVTSNNVENAIRLLNIARDIGFRRSGIISKRKNKVTLELISTERMETIISKKGEIIVDNKYLKHLIDESNLKLNKTRKKIDKFFNKLDNLYFNN